MRTAAIFLLLVMLGATNAQARYNDINYALNISGGAYVSVPYHSSLNTEITIAGRLTIDAWIKPAAIGSEMAIVGNNYAYWFGLDATGKLKVRFFNQLSFTGTGIISTSSWTHVAVAFDNYAGTLRLYINGALDRSLTHAGTVSGGTGALAIGADLGGAGAPVVLTPWNGALDEVRIWKHAIDFSSALGALTRTAHGAHWGLYGQYLVSAWRFNGGYLDNCGSNHGSIVGSATFSSTDLPPIYDRIGLAFQNHLPLGGGISVGTVPHSSSLNLTTSYTIECWIKPSSQNGHTTTQTIVSKGPATLGSASFWLGFYRPLRHVLFSPIGHTNVMGVVIESATSLPLDQWSHIAVTYGPENQSYRATILINGVVDRTLVLGFATVGNTAGLLIGAGSTDPAASHLYGFSGIIDELRIWNVARGNDEIADNHRFELTTPQTGLVANYRFDGDNNDWSGYANHANNLITNTLNYFVATNDLPGPPSLSLTEPAGGEIWHVGEQRHIRYKPVGLPWFRLEVSRDNGASFPEVITDSASAALGEFLWTVTDPVSSSCRIRATTRTTTPVPVGDTSAAFIIDEARPYIEVAPLPVLFTAQQNGTAPAAVPLRIWNTGGGTLEWDITTSAPSWLSIAALSGQGNDQTVELAVTTTALLPGEYTETLIVSSNATNGPKYVLVTYRVTQKKVWSISGRVTSGRDPLRHIRLTGEGESSESRWTDADGRYTLDLLEGDWVVAPRSVYYDFTPPQRDYPGLRNNDFGADFNGEPASAWVWLRYHEGWNLISIPVEMSNEDMTRTLPHVVPPAYIFDPDSGYLPRTMISSNVAYWMRFTQTDSVRLYGKLFRYSGIRTSTKISGWKMVATPSGDVDQREIEQTPPNILARLYEYDPLFGYFAPFGNIMRSGKAYFIKATKEGDLLLRAMEPGEGAPPPAMLRSPGARIDDSDLPPPPPRE